MFTNNGSGKLSHWMAHLAWSIQITLFSFYLQSLKPRTDAGAGIDAEKRRCRLKWAPLSPGSESLFWAWPHPAERTASAGLDSQGQQQFCTWSLKRPHTLEWVRHVPLRTCLSPRHSSQVCQAWWLTCPSLPWDFPSLVSKVALPRKSFSPSQTGVAGHPSQEVREEQFSSVMPASVCLFPSLQKQSSL